MQDVISYIKNSNLKKSAEDVVEPEEEETIHGDSSEEDKQRIGFSFAESS